MPDPATAAAALPAFASTARPLLARACLAVLAAAAVAAPVMSVASLGLSHGIAVADGRFVGAVALLVPAAFAVAVLASLPSRSRAHAKLIDAVAFIVALGVGLYVAYAVYASVADLSALEHRLSSMLAGTGVPAPGIDGIVMLEPAWGIVPWAILLPWAGARAVAGARH